MKDLLLLFPLFFSIFTVSSAQSVNTPDKIYGRLFTDVQMSRIFRDNETFADCLPKRDTKEIVEDYLFGTRNPAKR